MRSRQRAAWAIKSALFYLVMGPPIGAAAIVLFLFVVDFFQDPTTWPLTADWLIGAPLMLVFGYLFGAVPSLLTGFIAGWCVPRVAMARHVLLIGLIGAVVGAACALPLVLLRSSSGIEDTGARALSSLWLLAGPGFVAAMFCAWRESRDPRAPELSGRQET